MGIALAELLERLESEFPQDTAIDGDVTGLQLQAGRTRVEAILVCLDVTEDTVAEAEVGGYDTIVCFHPLVYHPLRALTEDERVGRLVTRLIRQGIAVIALHTRVDTHPDGTNARFAHALGLRVRGPLIRQSQRPHYGMGVIAEAEPPLAVEELLERVTCVVGQPIRYVPGRASAIGTLAIVGGSGASFLPEALACGAEAFVTGDVKYHAFHQAWGQLWLIDAGHAETERFAPEALADGLRRCLPPEVRVEVSKNWRPPIRWYWSDRISGSIADAAPHAASDLLPGARCRD